MKQLCCLLILCYAFISHSYSQEYIFTNYSVSEGLSQSVVNCIYQDSKGYIWLGTQNGLDRFDGRDFMLFRFNPTDSNSISNNWIYAISEDDAGNLWIGTKGGLHKYWRKENRFELLEYYHGENPVLSQYSYDNICLRNGDILINTPPLVSIYKASQDTFLHFASKFEHDPSVKDVKIPALEDKSGEVWLGSPQGLARFSPESGKLAYASFENYTGIQHSAQNITALFQDKENRMWVGTNNGLYLAHKQSLSFKEAEFIDEFGERFRFRVCVRSILQDKNGTLLIATEGEGIFALTQKGNGEFEIRNYNVGNCGIGHNIVQCLLIDRSENLWAGTLSGISKTDLKPKKFRLYRNSNLPNSTNLLGNVIAGMLKNSDGTIWVGNWGQGLNLVNPETREVEHFSAQHSGRNFLPNNFAHVIFNDSQNNTWLGTRDGIFIYHPVQRRFIAWTEFFNRPNFPSFEDTRIYHIIEDSEHAIWIASSNGVYRVNINEGEYDVFHTDADQQKQISANLVYSLLEDREGKIWMATINGLDVYDPRSETVLNYTKDEDGLSSNFIISLAEDKVGNIWVGSNAFINIFDKQTGKFTYLNENNGLPSNYIYSIEKDLNGDMWLATGNGLCRYVFDSGKIQVFNVEDGLQNLEFNLRASCACANGEMLFGGMNGFNTFFPDSIPGNPYKPQLEFTSFTKSVNDENILVNIENREKIVLKPDVQSFSIEFAALEFTNPEHNNYAYMMEGISQKWEKIGSRRFVPFFGLPPGEYIFHVMGANNDGRWNKQKISLEIVVLPPWWRSFYAYFVYLVLLLLAVWIFVKLREQHLLNDKIVLEKTVKERTQQIKEQNKIITHKNEELEELNRTKDKFFSIIGHDLRNHFNIIIGFSENLLTGKQKGDDRDEQLVKIHKASVHAHDLLGNLLTWARLQRGALTYSPEKIKVTKKIRALLSFHEESALKKNILLEVLAQKELDVRVDVNMFETIMRNLLSNAIKFTQNDGEVAIVVEKKDEFCQIMVADSGVGITSDKHEKIFRIDSNLSTPGTCGEKGTGLGLVICKEFVEKHKGNIWVESEANMGSKFIFTLPLK